MRAKREPLSFGPTLAALRRSRGHANAHAFYKASGGTRALGLSFAAYLAVEAGRSLPKPRRLEPLIKALGLLPASAERRGLVRAYMSSLLGDDALLRELEGPRNDAPPRLGEEAARQAVRQRATALRLDQWQLLAEDYESYACHLYLSNSPGFASGEEIASAVRLKPAAVKEALKKLARAGLLELSAGRARHRHVYKIVAPLPLSPATAGLKAALLRHNRRLLEDAPHAHRSWLTARLSQEALERYVAHLADAVNLAAIYGDAEKTADTSVYQVDALVTRLFP